MEVLCISNGFLLDTSNGYLFLGEQCFGLVAMLINMDSKSLLFPRAVCHVPLFIIHGNQ